MKKGDTILILPSFALSSMHLGELAGVRATVASIEYHNGHMSGCWATLPVEYKGETEWFIPYDSVGYL